MTAFTELGLGHEICTALAEQNYQTPTPIQAAAIPKALAGHDLLAAAQTGTGKTAAFMLPSLERLKRYANASASPAMHPVRMLVLTPTRELADQIDQNTQNYIKNMPLRHTVLFGGVNMNKQTADLRAGCEIVIATVGRLLDHVKQKNINLGKVEIVVLDEADRMLDMGFIDDIRTIMQMLPKPRQTLLFSATFAPDIRKLAQDFMNAPQIVEVAAQNTTNANVEEHVISIDSHRKRELLERLIVDLNMNQVIVFCKTKQSADQVSRDLVRRGLSANAIHGDKSQQTRLDVLNQFKSGELRVLVATDVAARGLDIAELPFVVNYEMPTQAEDYVHRIGRTGRAGADGVAISLMDETEQKMYEAIKALTGNELPISRIEGFEPRWEQAQAEAGSLKNENSPRATSRRSDREPQERGEKNDRRASSRNERGSRYQEIPTVDASKIPPRTSSRRRGRERRTCALLQRNFGVEA
ncbi:DEAD/DEAH box helicase [uncultured Kingella sp.]|uniref:DEAD/DEAH box helicase n=1 Tax=uncultured Kingella sp. TaxID=159270 RepID=UPI002597CD42|nr:DEAD/DEAH box helicase [uncultured Kingella sp.]